MFASLFREKRRDVRYETSVTAVLDFSQFKYKGTIKNISLGGAFLLLSDLDLLNVVVPYVGSQANMNVPVIIDGENRLFLYRCEVVYVIPEKGIALKFVDVDKSHNLSISSILKANKSVNLIN